MPIHEYMHHQVQLFSYLKKGLLHCAMELPTAQERAEQIFLGQPKMHQMKYAEMHKTVPYNIVPLIAFFEQCHNADQVSRVLDKLKKGKKKVNQDTDCKKALTGREQGCKKNMYHDTHHSSQDCYHDCRHHNGKRHKEYHCDYHQHDDKKTSIYIDMTRIAIIARSLMEIRTIMTRIAKKKIMQCM
jgi:hypothetical protein